MRKPFGEKQFGFSLFELIVSMVILLALAAVMLSRLAAYRADLEKLAVEQLIETLNLGLKMRMANPGATPGPAELQKLINGNPLDLLQRKPDNYLGEYYSPEIEKMPTGNWLFDRRDKCLIYLVKSTESSSFRASKFLKFKVEFRNVPMPRGKNEATDGVGGLTIKQVDN